VTTTRPRVDLSRLAEMARRARGEAEPAAAAVVESKASPVQADPDSSGAEPEADAAPPVESKATAAPVPAAQAADVAAMAEEVRRRLEEALAHPGVQASHAKLVLACHAAMADLLAADARDRGARAEAVARAVREAVPAERWDAWRADMERAVDARMAPLVEGLPARVQAAAREGARAVPRALDRRSAVLSACAGLGMAALGVVATVLVLEREVRLAEHGLELGLREAQAWVEVMRANPDPRPAMARWVERETERGDVYWTGPVGLWKRRAPAVPAPQR
jgi:hypothetical protein